MNTQNWAEQDIERGISYLADHEQEATDSTILTTGDGHRILLPTGLPAYGANIVGMFMMAPILLFMLVLTLFVLQIFGSGKILSTVSMVLILLCLALLLGLTRILRLMLKNRDLFPRCYFVTLGHRGIAMHFTRLHFPIHRPRMSIAWKDIQTVKKDSHTFMPVLFLGALRITTIDVVSSTGEKIIIPFRPTGKKAAATAEMIEKLIRQKIKR